MSEMSLGLKIQTQTNSLFDYLRSFFMGVPLSDVAFGLVDAFGAGLGALMYEFFGDKMDYTKYHLARIPQRFGIARLDDRMAMETFMESEFEISFTKEIMGVSYILGFGFEYKTGDCVRHLIGGFYGNT